MSYEKFQKSFEEEAEKAFQEYLDCSEAELIDLVKKKNWDATYQIWRALQVNGSEKSIETLFEIVSNLKVDYLIRYHACEALFYLAGIDDKEFKGMVQYGLDKRRKKVNQLAAIDKLKELLIKKFHINVC